MREEVSYHLERIIQAVDIGQDRSVSVYGKAVDIYHEFQIPEGYPISDPILFKGLQNLLYHEFYSVGTNSISESKKSPDATNSRHFLKSLQSANSCTEGIDKGWLVDDKTPNGGVLISKGGYKRFELPGGYFRYFSGNEPATPGEKAVLFHTNQYGSEQNHFYHVFGNTILENNSDQLVRFYFNLEPKGAPVLVAGITDALNHYGVPFSFKCLKSPELYTRADAGVLYFDKKYFHFMGAILPPVFDSIEVFLKSGNPLFSKTLRTGLGFAENPYDPRESFGTSRCGAIAGGIIRAVEKGAEKREWMTYVLKSFEDNLISVDTPYLNYNSQYPYSFELFA